MIIKHKKAWLQGGKYKPNRLVFIKIQKYLVLPACFPLQFISINFLSSSPNLLKAFFLILLMPLWSSNHFLIATQWHKSSTIGVEKKRLKDKNYLVRALVVQFQILGFIF